MFIFILVLIVLAITGYYGFLVHLDYAKGGFRTPTKNIIYVIGYPSVVLIWITVHIVLWDGWKKIKQFFRK